MTRHRWTPLAVILLAGIAQAPAEPLVEGSFEAGKAKSNTCAACHGADGNSQNPEWPSLAGQHSKYLYQQLVAYKEGSRQNVLMTAQALGLSDQDMRDLAVFYEAQTPALHTVADEERVSLGEEIFRGGEPESGVTACIACHGPAGLGNPAAAYPAIRAQHAVYTAAQLRAYAAGERRSDMNQMMRNVASGLTEEEILALASYVQGLRPRPPAAPDS